MWSVRKLWVLDCGLNEIQNGAGQGKGIRGLVSDLFAAKGTELELLVQSSSAISAP